MQCHPKHQKTYNICLVTEAMIEETDRRLFIYPFSKTLTLPSINSENEFIENRGTYVLFITSKLNSNFIARQLIISVLYLSSASNNGAQSNNTSTDSMSEYDLPVF